MARAALHMNGIASWFLTDKSGRRGWGHLPDRLTDRWHTLHTDSWQTRDRGAAETIELDASPVCGGGALVLCLLCLSAWPRGPAWLQTLVGPGPSQRGQWLARHGAGLLCCSVGNQASTGPLSYALPAVSTLALPRPDSLSRHFMCRTVGLFWDLNNKTRF